MKNDVISEAEKGEKGRPSILETKAIAEEGFIYGLPIVMNYAVMYEYSVDRNSGQFKAPFNQIKVFRSSTQFSAVAYRTQLFNPEDMPNVVKIQAGYKVQPSRSI